MLRTGQWLRFAGLLIEMIGLIGVVFQKPGPEGWQVSLPGGSTVSAWLFLLGIGLTIWMVGQVCLTLGRVLPRNRWREQPEPAGSSEQGPPPKGEDPSA